MANAVQPAPASPRRFLRFWLAVRWPLLAFAAAVALILAMTWPWCLHWRGEFLDHWDPPFHAWKLEFMARRILTGDIFCASGNTNMLYPQSGALYFEALQWPPALFAAALFALTSLPSETVYHLTLLLFWALSAPCMYLLLRELSCSKIAALAGALVFCILPHRMSYCVEFQMELIFAMPLVYFFFLRFFRTGRALDAVALAGSWWLLAVSELYEAVFVLLSLPVLALAFLAARPRLLATRRFWLGGLAAGATGVAFLPAMLLPYLTQQGEGTVSRSMQEVMFHCAQPFSYFLPWGRFRLWTLDAHLDELSLYPTLAVLLAAAAAAVLWMRRDWASALPFRDASGAPAWRRALRQGLRLAPPALHAMAPVSAVLFLLFLAAPLFGWHAWTPSFMLKTDFLRRVLKWSLLFLLVVPRRGESARTVFLRGLAVAAVLAWFLSFGPRIVVGTTPRQPIAKLMNFIYVEARDGWLPLLSNFRVVARFGVLVLFFLVCSAGVAVDAASRRARPSLRAALAAVLVALCAVESIPPKDWVGNYRRVDPMRKSPVVQRLLRERPPCTLAAVPVNPHLRELEGSRMFSLLKGDFLYVYVWGGYFPAFAEEIAGAFCHNLRPLWHEALASLYPDVLVLADRTPAPIVSPGHQPYAPGELSVGKDGIPRIDYDRWLAPVAECVAADDRFSLHRLKPLSPASRALKRFRTDIARLNPILEATISFDAPSTAVPVSLVLNGRPYGTFPNDATGRVRIRLDLSSLPRAAWSKSLPNSLEFVAGDGSPDAPAFRLESFSLLAPDGLYRDPCTGRSLDPASFPAPDAPWP